MSNHKSIIANTLPRETLLAVLADAPDDVLRGAVLALLSGTPAAASSEAVAAPAAKASKGGSTPATAPAGNAAVDDAIKALAVEGFAVGELAALTGFESRASALRTGIANAIKAGTLHTHGERRFLRYGATKAIAKARSEADQKGGK